METLLFQSSESSDTPRTWLDVTKKRGIRNGVSQIQPNLKIGILGGGQLARMLAMSAHQMGLEPHILSEKSDDPAQQVCSNSHVGSLKDESVLEDFIKKMDIVTFESEFLDSDLLLKISQRTKSPIHPSPQIMGQLQDRLSQKTLLDLMKIPTAEWYSINSLEACESAAQKLKFPFVIKKRRFGYDGYGTFIIKNKTELKTFINRYIPQTDGFIAEKWIPFKRELACIFARNPSGQIVHYPLVQSLQKDSRCFWVKGPIKHAKFSPWVNKFKKLLSQSNYVGVIGVELFDTPRGLIVNELAPRVHNTGHYTMDAFLTSQFELHIKALLDQPLTLPPPVSRGFAMVNLLGSKINNPKWSLDPKIRLHWYGKKDTRPGRKMGHINVVDSTPDSALKAALKALRGISL